MNAVMWSTSLLGMLTHGESVASKELKRAAKGGEEGFLYQWINSIYRVPLNLPFRQELWMA
jgi:hypothetical protein